MTGFTPPGAAGALPVGQRLVVRYAKRGRMRFASHRDIARAVERGVRRAALPVAYSAGFTPHPKISYAGAAPTGTASEAEYLELSLTQRCPVRDVRERLDAALPDGIDVIEVTEEPGAMAALRLEASLWEAVVPGVSPGQAAQAVAGFLACPAAEVERVTSKGRRRVDVRAAVVSMSVLPAPRTEAHLRGGAPRILPGAAAPRTGTRRGSGGGTGNAILRMAVRHVIPAVRPDDIFAALRRVAALEPSSPPVVTRLAQGPLDAVVAAAGADPGARRPPAGGTAARPARHPLPLGRSSADITNRTTRPAGPAAPDAGRSLDGAFDQLPRGADRPLVASAPGSLTGDSPHARQRAEQHRDQQ
jgi:radical SAM-linked protein